MYRILLFCQKELYRENAETIQAFTDALQKVWITCRSTVRKKSPNVLHHSLQRPEVIR